MHGRAGPRPRVLTWLGTPPGGRPRMMAPGSPELVRLVFGSYKSPWGFPQEYWTARHGACCQGALWTGSAAAPGSRETQNLPRTQPGSGGTHTLEEPGWGGEVGG